MKVGDFQSGFTMHGCKNVIIIYPNIYVRVTIRVFNSSNNNNSFFFSNSCRFLNHFILNLLRTVKLLS